MKIQTNINNPVFKDTNNPIEIFCNQKYKGYYIRGQIEELSGWIYDEELDKKYGWVLYLFRIFALVSNKYFSNIEIDKLYSNLGSFSGRTVKGYFKKLNEYELKIALSLAKHLNKTPQELTKESLKLENDPLLIDIKEVKIVENKYLKDSIEKKKDIILLSMGISLNRVGHHKTRSLIPYPYPKKTYTLLSNNWAEKSKVSEDEIIAWFNDLYEILYWNFNYGFTPKNEYFNILRTIGNVAYEWLKKKNVSKKYLQNLNEIIKKISDRTYPLYDFCYKFFDDLMDELINMQKIGKCEFCGNVFKYVKGKKYCSLLSEGKDCGKKARNKRFYTKHKDTILPKAKIDTQKYRKLLKEKNVKK